MKRQTAQGEGGNRAVLLKSLLAGLTITVIIGALNYANYAQSDTVQLGFFIMILGVTFVSAAFAAFVVQSIINNINNIKQNRLQKKWDDEERED